jgi:4-hydroxy-3-methylbut-2-enyl diphosphate reductase
MFSSRLNVKVLFKKEYMKINIDESAGFCWGVVRTVDIAEETLKNQGQKNVYILGQIIHNPNEISRLETKGLKTISHSDLEDIASQDAKVIIRAHGEPPSTYKRAAELGIDIIDATCPLVTSLQKRIRKYYENGWQIVIFGKPNHAEIIGIRGVCNDECIVVHSVDEAIEKVKLDKKTILFSQTTMDKPTFYKIKEVLEQRAVDFVSGGDISELFLAKDSICKAVSGREEPLREFASTNDIILFVAGRHSSNGKSLFHFCQEVNQRTYFIEDISEIDYDWFEGVDTIGITGATSTPKWYMDLVKREIEKWYETQFVI